MATHPCPGCGKQTGNAGLCDSCGIELVKKAGREVGKRKGNGQGPKNQGKGKGKS